MNTIEIELNKELSKVLGADSNWLRLIERAAIKRMKIQGGAFDDVVANVSGDIILKAKDGKLAEAVIRAKDSSENEEELVSNLSHVVKKAAYFRVSDIMKNNEKTPSSRDLEEAEYVVKKNRSTESENLQLEEYKELILNELEVMATSFEWRNNSVRAKRLRLAKKVVLDRLDGYALGDLMKRHNVSSKATMQAILDDIGQAVARIAIRLDDEVLIKGTSKIKLAA
jgi:hypothetical protein